jgi:hypothetical protein
MTRRQPPRGQRARAVLFAAALTACADPTEPSADATTTATTGGPATTTDAAATTTTADADTTVGSPAGNRVLMVVAYLSDPLI